jgi:thiamine biosynthesis lipoprotein
MAEEAQGQRQRKLELAVAGAALLVALLPVWPDDRPGPPRDLLQLTGETMATSYSVKLVEPGFDDGVRQALRIVIQSELELVNAQMSRHREGSEIDLLNRSSSTEPVRVSPELLQVLVRAEEIGRLTGGAFDITVGPLTRLWGFEDKRALKRAPDEAVIEQLRAGVGFELLEIDEQRRTVRKRRPELDLDLSAIAKGYAVDRIALALERRGHHNFLVEVGGEVRSAGLSHRGTPWRVAVEKPTGGARVTFRVVELSGLSLATSGDYRNFYELDGRRVSHTVDPRTGRPVEPGLASVTVVHEECMTADALATALTVLGARQGRELAEQNDLRALFITRADDGALEARGTTLFERHHPAGGTARSR